MSWPRNLFPPRQHPTDHHGPSIPDEPDDAELIATCAAFDDLERRYRASFSDARPGSPDDIAGDAERARLVEAQRPLVDIMTGRQALTREGQVARARSLILWAPEMMEEGPGDTAECLTYAVLRDLVAEVGS